MPASNKPQPPVARSLELLPHELASAVLGLWQGSLGRTVRCVPTRRTVMVAAAGAVVFGKWRRGARRAAAAEWRWLHLLPMLGVRTAAPLVWLGRGRRSLLVTEGVPGRAVDAWFAAARAEGWSAALCRALCLRVAPFVRRLHDHGLVHRDLYWNHVVCEDPRGDATPVLIDVERVFRPRWRWRRWVTKDLAGLLSSAPDWVSTRQALRFLRTYLGEPLHGHRATIEAIAAKAQRIRSHTPRFGA
jgi:hypothetical protein